MDIKKNNNESLQDNIGANEHPDNQNGEQENNQSDQQQNEYQDDIPPTSNEDVFSQQPEDIPLHEIPGPDEYEAPPEQGELDDNGDVVQPEKAGGEERFLPDDFTVPSPSSIYYKPEVGSNQVRLLCQAVQGTEAWLNKKVTRYRKGDKPLTFETGTVVKEFIACEVWDYKDERIKIWIINQKTIQRQLDSLDKDKFWGDALKYDLNVKREGDSLQTEYNVVAFPHSVLLPYIREASARAEVNMDALFDGGEFFPNK